MPTVARIKDAIESYERQGSTFFEMLLTINDIVSEKLDEEEEFRREREDNYTDVEADANTLASAGWGTDEDYGYYGPEE